MSNYLAIANVTAVLYARFKALEGALTPITGLDITTTRPDKAAAENKGAWINVFLYQVAPNPAYRNEDLPTRRADGQLAQRPRAALILRYLISVAGNDSTLESHLLLGAVVRELHARPVLTPNEVRAAKSSRSALVPSDLDEQIDLVRVTPLSLSGEELSKLWSTFFEIPYLLSVAYEAGAVLIESEDSPVEALRVKQRLVKSVPIRQPRVDSVVSQAGDTAPIFFNSVLLIRGAQLRSDDTRVLLGGKALVPPTLTDTQITLPLPAGIGAGVQALQVIQNLLLGDPVKPHLGFESNASTFVVTPTLTGPATKTTVPQSNGGTSPGLILDADVTVFEGQRVVLLLNGIEGAGGHAYSFIAESGFAGTQAVTFATPDVFAGKYLLRVQIDGAASPLELDPSSAAFGPLVTMP